MTNISEGKATYYKPPAWKKYLPLGYGLATIALCASFAPGWIQSEIERNVKATVSTRRLAVSIGEGQPRLPIDVDNKSIFTIRLESVALKGSVLGVDVISSCGSASNLDKVITRKVTTEVDIPLCTGLGDLASAVRDLHADAAQSAVSGTAKIRVLGIPVTRKMSFNLDDAPLRAGLRVRDFIRDCCASPDRKKSRLRGTTEPNPNMAPKEKKDSDDLLDLLDKIFTSPGKLQ